MRQCPKCGKTYDNSWKVCLIDNVILMDNLCRKAVDVVNSIKKYKEDGIDIVLLAWIVGPLIAGGIAFLVHSIPNVNINLVTNIIRYVTMFLFVSIGIIFIVRIIKWTNRQQKHLIQT